VFSFQRLRFVILTRVFDFHTCRHRTSCAFAGNLIATLPAADSARSRTLVMNRDNEINMFWLVRCRNDHDRRWVVRDRYVAPELIASYLVRGDMLEIEDDEVDECVAAGSGADLFEPSAYQSLPWPPHNDAGIPALFVSGAQGDKQPEPTCEVNSSGQSSSEFSISNQKMLLGTSYSIIKS
jgi:hypothetical protein